MAPDPTAKMPSTASVPKPEPLDFTTRLSPWVYTYQPDQVATSGAETTAPKLIILLTWLEAGPTPIAKYVRGYQSLYPSSRILLIRSTARHLLWRPKVITKDIQPAVSVVRETHIPDTTSSPSVLVHVWSNGGTAMFCHLLRAYDTEFPRHITVFDSSPGMYGNRIFVRAGTAQMSKMARAAIFPLGTLLALFYQLWYTGRPDALTQIAERLNSRTSEERRVYIYSSQDVLIKWRVVEEHARVAKERGYNVRMEKFEGTQHVSHMRGNEDKYWTVVSETWQGLHDS